MTNNIDTLKLDRRQLLKTLAAAAAVLGLPSLAAAESLKGTLINHLSYSCGTFIKTRDFYRDLFGFQVSDADDRQLYLWAGNALISVKNAPRMPKPIIDHIGLIVDPWSLDTVEAVLKGRGLEPRVAQNDAHDPHHRSAFVRDVEGYNLQLCAPDLETRPAPVASHAPLQAVGINHISYQCADYGKARDFYSQLLNAPVSNDTGKQAYVWFGDACIVFRNGPADAGRPVIDHMAWTLADWDPKHVLSVLKTHGLDGKADPAGKSVMVKDLNGYPLQLCSKDLTTRPA